MSAGSAGPPIKKLRQTLLSFDKTFQETHMYELLHCIKLLYAVTGMVSCSWKTTFVILRIIAYRRKGRLLHVIIPASSEWWP